MASCSTRAACWLLTPLSWTNTLAHPPPPPANLRVCGLFRKTHLFDINIPGKIEFKESATLSAGAQLTCLPTRFGTLAVGICYDLRFPEMAMIYRDRGADLLIYPGAFNMTTGPLHWQLLQQARALDNQLFVASCSPARDESGPYVAWGHSMVVGPFGEVLGCLGAEEGVLMQQVDFGEVAERRRNIPIGSQKRSDLYRLVDVGGSTEKEPP